ncbi:polar amino acid transport system substrate-binding protein [Chitinivorax tropicus]|uniref:Polar amino acid transport system substrate-binding protein n=1 Tax=Chitinivorax tropicus TaxID=714531 RepID=A0A840MIC1_9PROT|nr:transporter substrate-binding domain-containing protein [Chitinivorax tropicus]MBB5018398.1 polar amino acid transport system substrate-binding protein [Chitinivorax tropicus]
MVVSPRIWIATLSLAMPLQAEVLNCVGQSLPPLVYKDANGDVTGFAVDMVRLALGDQGDNLKMEIVSWSRALEMIKRGSRDCIFTIGHTPERANWMDFSKEMIVPSVVYFYARKGLITSPVADWSIIAGKRAAMVRNFMFGEQFEAIRDQLVLFEVSTIEQGWANLLAERVDLLPIRHYSADYSLQQLPPDKAARLVRLQPALEVVASRIAYTRVRDLSAWRDRIDRGLRALRQSNKYRELFALYQMEMTPEVQQALTSP